MRKKRLLTYSLAFAMAVSMAAPQAAMLPASLKAVNVYAEEVQESELKNGTAVTKAEWGENWSGTEAYIKISEIGKSSDEASDYSSKINKVIVNNTEYPVYDEESKGNYYTVSYFDGLCIYMGSVVDGENTILVSSNGYKDKKIVVSVDKTAKTVSFISQEDLDSGEAVVDKTPLNNMITAAKAYEQGTASDEKWTALQDAITAAQGVYDNDNATQDDIDAAVTALKEAIDTFNKKDSENNNIENPVEDGEYTLSYSVEDSTGGNMIAGTIDSKAKLTVENGKMKISMLNINMQDYLLDLSVGSNAAYNLSEVKEYSLDGSKSNYKEYTIEIDDITQNLSVAALVSAMGGQASDKGNWSKYNSAAITVTSVKKGWDGYKVEQQEESDADKTLINALVTAGYDTDGDGAISEDEWNAISGEVNLSGYNLTDITLLTRLSSNVTSLDLSNNKIKEIPAGLLAGKTKLEQFYIENNEVKDIPANLFKDAAKLDWISFAGNNLTSIEKNDFAGLDNLTILDLGSNAIESIEAGAFDSLTKLDDFGLGSNKLTDLPSDLMKSMGATLESISLDNNELVKIPDTVEQLQALQILAIFNNKITNLDNIDFSKLPNLKVLNLKSNEIKELPSNMLAQNKNITQVDFFDNKITSVSKDMFPKVDGGIHKLDLQLNEMVVVDPEVRKMAKSFNKQYPQKTVLNFNASADAEKNIKWNQDLSILDLMFWYDTTQSDEESEVADVTGYKALLNDNYEGKELVDILNDKNYDWDIVTEVQKQNEDGTYTTISKEKTSEEKDALNGTIKVDSNGIYRVKKTVYSGTSGLKPYRFAVYSNDVTVKDSNKQDNNNNSTTQKKPQTTTQEKQNTTKVKVAKVKKLKAKNLSRKKVRLSWKKVKGASGYKVYRATKKNGKYKLVKTIKNVKTVKFIDKKVKKNKTYYYKVSAYKTVAKKVVKGTASSKVKVVIRR